ncbi:MAG TPA: HAD family phosphatase [Anaerolineaceae bacterium]|nr:HAD family phosphatase [Anaerolineaceae bacterium]
MEKAIVFDFGGVLIDWSPYHLYRKLLPSDEAVREFLEEIKFSEFNKKLDAGYPFSKMKVELLEKYPLQQELVRAFFDRWMECTGEALQPTVDIMREVKAEGYPVFGLSNWSTETFPLLRHRYPFLPELDDYLLSGMAGVAKPDEEIFRIFLQRVGRDADECVFIDDAQVNIDTARRLGFTGILFRDAPQLRSDLQELGILNGKPAAG